MKKNMLLSLFVLGFFALALVTINQNLLFSAEKKAEKKGYLGVTVEPLSRQLKKDLKAEFGVVVMSIEEDSPADKSDLMEDDVIQQVNDVKIRRPSTLTRVIRKIEPGQKAKIIVIRDGKEQTITVTMGKLKGSRSFSFSIGPEVNAFRWLCGGTYLGVNLHELNDDLASYFGVKENEGALILNVEEDSPAEKAGLKAGDVITKIDDEAVSAPQDVQEVLSDCEEDEVVKIQIIRKGKPMTIEATLDERKGHENIFFSPYQKSKEIKVLPKRDRLFDLRIPEIDIQRNLPKIKVEKREYLSTDMI